MVSVRTSSDQSQPAGCSYEPFVLATESNTLYKNVLVGVDACVIKHDFYEGERSSCSTINTRLSPRKQVFVSQDYYLKI